MTGDWVVVACIGILCDWVNFCFSGLFRGFQSLSFFHTLIAPAAASMVT